MGTFCGVVASDILTGDDEKRFTRRGASKQKLQKAIILLNG